MNAADASTRAGARAARFEALRTEGFADAVRLAARWKLAWLLPFNAFVLVLLVARGESLTRSLIQGGTLAVCILSMAIGQPAARGCVQSAVSRSMAIGWLCYLVSVANTGGLASPLLVSGVPIAMGASLSPMPRNKRIALFTLYGPGFLGLALLAHTAVGELAGPLAPTGAWSSPAYVMLSMGSLVFAAGMMYGIGERVSVVYEKVASELAGRREEICSEGEDRTRALEGIAARLAHEVKNPLAAIKGLSSHMAKNTADPKAAERLAIVAAEAERLQEIVEGFLSFSRGLDDLKLMPTRPHEIAREIALLLETRAQDSGISLEVKGSPELVLNADPRKLRQALLNFVLNAMQASPPGSVVTVETAKQRCGSATIKVMDRGTGMSPEILDRIRKPYFTTKEGGTGLGIAVARGLIEQHGGHVGYESLPGRGTTVTVDLPACAQGALNAKKLPNPAHDAAPDPSAPAAAS